MAAVSIITKKLDELKYISIAIHCSAEPSLIHVAISDNLTSPKCDPSALQKVVDTLISLGLPRG